MTASTPTCPDCQAGLEHCHAVLAVHSDEVTECLHDRECAGEAEHHQDVVPCRTVFRACSCTMGLEAARRFV